MISISIVIPTYGDPGWEELAWSRAYTSVALQTTDLDEVIVHHEPDMSIGPARNAAAALARGDFLIFLDADDELEDGYVDAMRKAAWGKSHNVTLFQPAVQYIRKGRAPEPFMVPQKDLRVDNFLVIGTMLRRDLFHQVGGFEDYPHGFEDWSLWAKAWKEGAHVVSVPSAVYKAFINPQSDHRKRWRDRREQVRQHLQVQAELFPGGIENWAR